jgi:hypothetical protein
MYLSACKKDHNTPGNSSGKQYNLRVNVSNFSQTISSNSLKLKAYSVVSTPDSLGLLITYLRLVIYDYKKNVYINDSQINTSPTFGAFDEKIPAGTYRLCIFGYSNQYYSSNFTTGILSGQWDSNLNYVYVDQWSPVYSYSQPLTIISSDANRTATLKRATSQLVVHINDAIPSSVYGIQLTPSNNYAAFDFYNNAPVQFAFNASAKIHAKNANYIIPDSSKGKTGFQMVYNLMMDTTISVDIIAYGANYNETLIPIAEKTVQNVTIHPNDQVTLSGDLFGGNSGTTNTGFTVSVNTTWSPIPITQTFSLRKQRAHN